MVLFLYLFVTCFVVIHCDKQDGGKANRISLNDGNSIPAIGLGTFLGFDENGQKEVKDNEVEIPVTWGLEAGYRMFDTAQAYKNEKQIGSAVYKSSVPRENIFIVTKLASNKQRKVVPALRESLLLLNMTYVDLYLIHNPVAFTPDDKSFDIIDYLDTWKGMEEAKRIGLTKSIGISNFNISQIERLMANSEVTPSVLQVEVNLNLAQNNLLNFCKTHNIAVMGYTPFGSMFDYNGQAPPPRANDTVLVNMAQKYGKTVPQIVLRYLVQRGVVPIPKSVNKERLEKNIKIFDFKLDSEDINTLAKFNKDYRTVFPSFWQDHPYYAFERTDMPSPDIFKRN